MVYVFCEILDVMETYCNLLVNYLLRSELGHAVLRVKTSFIFSASADAANRGTVNQLKKQGLHHHHQH